MFISQQKLSVRLSDLFLGCFRSDSSLLRPWIPRSYHAWTGSGREALRQILLYLQEGKKDLRIGMPAYTCHVVLDAVQRAGVKPIFYDSGVVADISEIKKIIKSVDALLVCYNFGFLPAIDNIQQLCKQEKVILIEDCAQALGATYKGKLAGSFGDYAFYSFGISKPIGFCGGLIASDIPLPLKKMKTFPRLRLAKAIFEVMVAPFFFHPFVYRWTRYFLGKELGKKQNQLSYSLPSFARRIIQRQMKKYHDVIAIRQRNAAYCLNNLRNKDFVVATPHSTSSWLYFCFISKHPTLLQDMLLKKGVEVGKMHTFRALYPSPKAIHAEQSVLTFALYRPLKEIVYVVDCLNNLDQKESSWRKHGYR